MKSLLKFLKIMRDFPEGQWVSKAGFRFFVESNRRKRGTLLGRDIHLIEETIYKSRVRQALREAKIIK